MSPFYRLRGLTAYPRTRDDVDAEIRIGKLISLIHSSAQMFVLLCPIAIEVIYIRLFTIDVFKLTR